MRPHMIPLLPFTMTLRNRTRELRVRRLHQTQSHRLQHLAQRPTDHTRTRILLAYHHICTLKDPIPRRRLIQRKDHGLHALVYLRVEYEIGLSSLFIRHGHAEGLLDLVDAEGVFCFLGGLIDETKLLAGWALRVSGEVKLEFLAHGNLEADVFAGEEGAGIVERS